MTNRFNIVIPKSMPVELLDAFKAEFDGYKIDYVTHEIFDVYQIINNVIDRSHCSDLYEIGYQFLVKRCRNPDKHNYQVKKTSMDYIKASIAKGKNGHIPQMIQPIDYVERFNQLAESKGMNKAQTFRFLVDDYYKRNIESD